ncbi:hypothetical protein NW768_007582 [Fusarium equiseti]|uniref:NACHT domain-containing protein n=1 Tax=Fusarium equiseti TaxID=61235 RepID=A0ABQ8R829_FUSEQ|nr:hypothetical protein NW768_007582 [Fusarium equiseti]
MKRLSNLKRKILHKDSSNEPQRDQASGSSSDQPTTVPTHPAKASSTNTLPQPTNNPPPSLISNATATGSSPTAERQMSISERLWKKAYSSLDEPKVVEAYEAILQRVQHEWNTDTTPEDLQRLEHCKSPESRKMWRVVYSGLEKSKKQAKVKESISDVMTIVDSIKGVVDKAVKYSSEASIVWAGVSLGLEILSNPMKEPGLNRKAIVYVVSRMEWYWNLVDLAIDEDRTSMPSATLRSNLESQIVKFYKKLLLFQMYSACLYYRNWASVLVRDLVKLDDWSEKLTEVKNAEDLLRKDMDQFCNEDTNSKLQVIEASSLSQAESLERIFTALREDAQVRQKTEQDEQDRSCIADLFETDPRMDKKRLQRQKGDPLRESYEWILSNEAYQTFMTDRANTVLWINGSPGKGKTMLICGLIDELQPTLRPLSFFFCQASVKEEDRSSDIAVLRGLIYLLLEYQPSLVSILRPHYDKQKERLFSNINSAEQLGEILGSMLQDPSLHDAILLVDALDECTKNRAKLTSLIVQLSGLSTAKWIISSRDWPEIRQDLVDTNGLIPLDLEQEQESVSGAVRSYISNKIDDLARMWGNDTTIKQEVLFYMESHASNTFLWVALVCDKLSKSPKRRILEELRQFPSSLTDLYKAMLDRIKESSEADQLMHILAIACIVHRPLGTEEISTFVDSMLGYDEDDVKDVISSCGSFLTCQEGLILFVHQSVKEFLLDQGKTTLFPLGSKHCHKHIGLRSLDAMENTLRVDIYELGSPDAYIIDEAPSPDPLGPIEYSCAYWAHHLYDSDLKDEPGIATCERILKFLQTKFTCWLEALSLLGSISFAITNIAFLGDILDNVDIQELGDFIDDAMEFINRHTPAITGTSLQVYASGLVFSPQSSVIRKQFSHQIPIWIALKPEMEEEWNTGVRTIYLGSEPEHVSYSPDGQFLAYSEFEWSEICHTTTGDSIYQVESGPAMKAPIYSPDGLMIGCAITEGIAVLDATTFSLIRILEVNARQLIFLPEGAKLVAVVNGDVVVVDWNSGKHICSLHRIVDEATDIALLSESSIVGVSAGQTDAKVWDLYTGECRHTFQSNDEKLRAVACSFDGHSIAGRFQFKVRLWTLSEKTNWVHKHDLSHQYELKCVAFSADSRMVISGAWDDIIRIWDETGTCIKVLKGHTNGISCLAVCQANNELLSGGGDGTLKTWDLSRILSDQIRKRRSSSLSDRSVQWSEQSSRHDEPDLITGLVFSPTGHMVASVFYERTDVWETTNDSRFQLLFSGGTSEKNGISFTPDERLVAMTDKDGNLGVWDRELRAQIHSSEIQDPQYICIASDGSFVTSIALLDIDEEQITLLRVWDLSKDPQTEHHVTSEVLPLESDDIDWQSYLFSTNWKLIAASTVSGRLKVIHRDSGLLVNGQEEDGCLTPLAFSPDNQWLLTYDEYRWDFSLRRLTEPYDFVKLGSIDHDGSSASACSEHVDWQVPTQFGILGICNTDTFSAVRIGWGLSVTMDWVMRGNERMLWIPAEYRRLAVDTNGTRVAFVDPSGRIRMMKFR